MGFKALGLEACPVANTEEARETQIGRASCRERV